MTISIEGCTETWTLLAPEFDDSGVRLVYWNEMNAGACEPYSSGYAASIYIPYDTESGLRSLHAATGAGLAITQLSSSTAYVAFDESCYAEFTGEFFLLRQRIKSSVGFLHRVLLQAPSKVNPMTP